MEAAAHTLSRLPAGVTVVLGALAFGAFRQGAYHESQHAVFAVLIGIGCVFLFAEPAARSSLPRVGLIVAPLVAATALSTALSSDRSDAGSTFLLIGLVAIGLLAGAAAPRDQRSLVTAALTGIALVVAVTAIWGVAAHSVPWGRVTEGVWRGSSSLTYSNAAAAVLGPVSLITFIKAVRDDDRIYAATTVLLAIGFASTQSRGGALALLLIAPFVIGHVGLRRFASAALPIGFGVAIGVPLLLARASTSATPLPVAVVALIALGMGATALLWPKRAIVAQPHLVLLGLLGFGAGVVALSPLGDQVTQRLTLRSGTTAGGEDAGVLFGDRAQEWSVAWERFREQPFVGHGPGVVDLTWVEDGRGLRAMFVHNEYLELAVTHGVLGVVALLASGILLARHLRFNEQTWPMALALALFLLHSTVDFLWHLPALPVLFAVVIGLWMAHSSGPDGEEAVAETSPDPEQVLQSS